MKKEFEVFACDNCGEKEFIKRGTGFPYEKEWCYIYNMEAKVLASHYPAIETNIAKVKLHDKHFCCTKCMYDYIRKQVREKIRKENKPVQIDMKECEAIFKGSKLKKL